MIFLIYMNDLPHASQELKLILIADDTTFVTSNADPTALSNPVNTELAEMSTWITTNKPL